MLVTDKAKEELRDAYSLNFDASIWKHIVDNANKYKRNTKYKMFNDSFVIDVTIEFNGNILSIPMRYNSNKKSIISVIHANKTSNLTR